MPLKRQRRFVKGRISLIGTPAEVAAIDGGNLSLTLSTGAQQGDVVYVFVGLASAINGGTTSLGWTQVGSTTDNTVRTLVFRKVMDSTPDASIAITGTAGVNDVGCAIAYTLRGVDNVTPEDATPTTATGSSTTPDSPSITTVTPNAWVLSFFCSRGSTDTTVTLPSGYSNQVDVTGNDSNDSTVGGATKEIASPGAEDPASWTAVNTGLWVAWSVAVRPA